jgi:hypothetical protein
MRSLLAALGRALALVFVAALWACDSQPLAPESSDRIIIDFGDPMRAWPKDPWRLQEAQVDDALLQLTVEYSGGCNPHEFWLVAVGDWEALPNAGPTPLVAVPILLAHEDHDDPCDAVVFPTLEFDLEPLRTAYHQEFGFGPGTILLRIPEGQGAADSVTVGLAAPAAYPPD